MTTFTIRASPAPLARGQTWYVLAHLAPDTPAVVAAICDSTGWATRVKRGLELAETISHSPTRQARQTARRRQAST
jgi:hypothetical protein